MKFFFICFFTLVLHASAAAAQLPPCLSVGIFSYPEHQEFFDFVSCQMHKVRVAQSFRPLRKKEEVLRLRRIVLTKALVELDLVRANETARFVKNLTPLLTPKPENLGNQDLQDKESRLVLSSILYDLYLQLRPR